MQKLYFIGTGEPTPTTVSCGTCYVLQVNNDYLMFDCGTGATYKFPFVGLFPTQIEHLFFTHHHFDHNADYPAFLLIRWDQSLNEDHPLRVYGPPPTEWITDRLIGPEGAFRDDLKARVEHPASHRIYKMRGGIMPRPTRNCIARDIKAGEIIEGDGWKVTCAPAQHVEPWLKSLAFRVDTPEGAVVIAGDTGPCDSIANLAEGADTLIAHCKNLQKDVPSDLGRVILGTVEAAKMANLAGIRRLVLSHQNIKFHQQGIKEKGIAEISTIFKGEIVFAEELTILEI